MKGFFKMSDEWKPKEANDPFSLTLKSQRLTKNSETVLSPPGWLLKTELSFLKRCSTNDMPLSHNKKLKTNSEELRNNSKRAIVRNKWHFLHFSTQVNSIPCPTMPTLCMVVSSLSDTFIE